MDLREKLIALSEENDIGEFYSEELKEKVYYCKLDTKDGTALGKILQTDDNIMAKMIIKSLCDKEGKLLFKSSDIEYVNRLPIAFSTEVFEKILQFNKMIPGTEKN